MDAVNPLNPAPVDLVFSSLAVVALGLAVWALVSLSRGSARLSSPLVLMWAALILIVPVLGPVAWLSAGRRVRERSTRV